MKEIKSMQMKEVHLLLKSAATEGFPVLKQFLLNHPNGARQNDIAADEEIRKIFETGIYSKIYLQAKNEWIISSADAYTCIEKESERIPCEICNSKLKHVYKISNRINNMTLRVGSECIRHFGINRDASGKTIEEITAEGMHTRMYESLAYRYGNITVMRKSWASFLGSQPIFIPDPLGAEYEKSTKAASESINQLMSSKQSTAKNKIEDHFNVLDSTIPLIHSLEKDIQNYVKAFEVGINTPKREYVRYAEKNLEGRKFQILIDCLNQDKKITWRSSRLIKHPQYVNEALIILRNEYQNSGLTIHRYIEDSGELELSLPTAKNLKINTDYEEFMLAFAGPLFAEECNTDFFEMLRYSKVKDFSTIQTLLHNLHLKTKLKGIELHEIADIGDDYPIFLEYDDYFVYDAKIGKYRQIPLLKTIQANMSILFEKTENIDPYVNYVRSEQRVRSKSDFYTLLRDRLR